MSIEIQEIGVDELPEYAEIPIAYKVESVFHVDLVNSGLGGIRLREEKIVPAYTKDYDSCEDEDDRPTTWPKRFEISNWGIFVARDELRCVAGASVAFDTSGMRLLDGRRDLAVLWDIRVHPDFRRCGIGTQLFNYAVDWSRKRKCKQLKVETQNVNVPACRFYAKQGCKLGEINRYGYFDHPEVRHEVMLIWYIDI